jgi:S-adenosylmethionine:tRNA ribosyltransferase-isomerase
VTGLPAFALPERLEAHEPPEARGLARDEVRMMVARRSGGRLAHARVRDLPDFLRPGDLVVVNTSATIPAALPARRADGLELELHLSTPLPGAPEGHWVVELRHGGQRFRAARAGDRLSLPARGRAELAAPYLAGSRLWAARLELPAGVIDYLSRHGAPIRYGHVRRPRPLADYQTAYATEPGSAEMPSAGRPVTARVITALVARGVGVAPVVLHTGVSSLELGERPYPERFRVPATTARLIEATRRSGGRVIAVGTTVVRALETAAGRDATVRPREGWTSLVITPERGVQAVDGLLTGWHDPAASHLDLLEAVGGRDLVGRSYREALAHGYLWHEFGDSHLILC